MVHKGDLNPALLLVIGPGNDESDEVITFYVTPIIFAENLLILMKKVETVS